MSILVVNQSVIDMCASFFILLLAVPLKMTGMSRDSVYDQFVCRFWLTKRPLWCLLITSTYGILLLTLSRYIAVIHPMKYKQVRIAHLSHLLYRSVVCTGPYETYCAELPTLLALGPLGIGPERGHPHMFNMKGRKVHFDIHESKRNKATVATNYRCFTWTEMEFSGKRKERN